LQTSSNPQKLVGISVPWKRSLSLKWGRLSTVESGCGIEIHRVYRRFPRTSRTRRWTSCPS
jgi:hypothetical protein